MSTPPIGWADLSGTWDRFFHAPLNTRACIALRIGYTFFLLVGNLVLAPDLVRFFGEDGVLPYAVSRQITNPNAFTLFEWLPKSHQALWIAFAVYNLQVILLMCGVFTRLQAVCVFVWLVSFQHRHVILFDAEDNVFRLLGFLLIFMPSADDYSFDAWWRRRKGATQPASARPAWALRLFQIQMSVIYLSTAWEKASGKEWVDGTAFYYVTRLDDLFGRFPLPTFVSEYMPLMKAITWSVPVTEVFIGLGLWMRETRRWALGLALLFHLGCDYSMNLFLFHWIMLVGLCAFVLPEDFELLRAWKRRLFEPKRVENTNQAT